MYHIYEKYFYFSKISIFKEIVVFYTVVSQQIKLLCFADASTVDV